MEEEECLMMIPVSSSSSSPFFGLYHQRQQTKNVPSPTTTTTTTNNSSSNNKQRRNNRQHIIKVGFMIVIISCFLSFLLFVQNSWVWKHRVIIPSRTSISFKNNNNNNNNNETTEEKRSKDEDDDTTTTTNNNNNKNKIGLVSYCFGEKFIKLRELVRYNHQIYASHHDNVYIFEGNSTTMPYESFITPPAWLKVAYLYQLLLSSSSLRSSSSVTTNDDDPSSLNNIEWFVWIDCDAIIARYDISIESLLFTNNNNKQLNNINVQPFHHIVVADDKPVDSPFNTGVMFVRNCLWSKQFFQRALQLSSNDTIRYHKWWEQKAFSELYLNNLHNEQSHVYVVRNGRSIFNGFAGMNKPYQPSYIDNTTFIWHRVHCNTTTTTTTTTAINKKNEDDYYENDCCFNFSISFFCSKTPSPSNDNNNNNGKIYSFYPKNYCKGIPPWEPPSKTNHC